MCFAEQEINASLMGTHRNTRDWQEWNHMQPEDQSLGVRQVNGPLLFRHSARGTG
jgi:hypothetical protein